MSNDWENILKQRLDEKSSGSSSRRNGVSSKSSGNGTSKRNGISKSNGNGTNGTNGTNGASRDSVRLSDLAPPDDLREQIHGSTQLLSDDGILTVDAGEANVGGDIQLIVEIEELKVRLEASEAARMQADRRISELEIDLQNAQRELQSNSGMQDNSEMMAAHVIEIQELDQEILRLRAELEKAKSSALPSPTRAFEPPPPAANTAELNKLRADLAEAHGIIRAIEEAYLISEGLMDPSERK